MGIIHNVRFYGITYGLGLTFQGSPYYQNIGERNIVRRQAWAQDLLLEASVAY